MNYLWPLLIVVLAPLILPGMRLRAATRVAAVAGFAARPSPSWARAARQRAAGPGATCRRWGRPSSGPATRCSRAGCEPFPTAAIGLFGLVSGLLSLLCHALLEPPATLSCNDWVLIAAMGLGPLGAAFFLWDKALKLGDPRQIGILSYITPLASTVLLMLVSGRAVQLEHRWRRRS